MSIAYVPSRIEMMSPMQSIQLNFFSHDSLKIYKELDNSLFLQYADWEKNEIRIHQILDWSKFQNFQTQDSLNWMTWEFWTAFSGTERPQNHFDDIKSLEEFSNQLQICFCLLDWHLSSRRSEHVSVKIS